ncbi:hypothetical protein MHYP_G00167990 [Metynnis hypsauchen]
MKWSITATVRDQQGIKGPPVGQLEDFVLTEGTKKGGEVEDPDLLSGSRPCSRSFRTSCLSHSSPLLLLVTRVLLFRAAEGAGAAGEMNEVLFLVPSCS